jgi:hypothetical protein
LLVCVRVCVCACVRCGWLGGAGSHRNEPVTHVGGVDSSPEQQIGTPAQRGDLSGVTSLLSICKPRRPVCAPHATTREHAGRLSPRDVGGTFRRRPGCQKRGAGTRCGAVRSAHARHRCAGGHDTRTPPTPPSCGRRRRSMTQPLRRLRTPPCVAEPSIAAMRTRGRSTP